MTDQHQPALTPAQTAQALILYQYLQQLRHSGVTQVIVYIRDFGDLGVRAVGKQAHVLPGGAAVRGLGCP